MDEVWRGTPYSERYVLINLNYRHFHLGSLMNGFHHIKSLPTSGSGRGSYRCNGAHVRRADDVCTLYSGLPFVPYLTVHNKSATPPFVIQNRNLAPDR